MLVFGFHCLWPAFGFDQLKWNGWLRDFDAPMSMLALFPLTMGWLGVAMFFVVSGFCIQLSWDRRPAITAGTFFIRRFFRIYPPYLLALLVFVISPWTIPAEVTAPQVGSHLMLVHNFKSEWYYGINAAFWSIAVEFQLYLLYPLLRMAVARAGWITVLWVLGVIEFSLRAYASSNTAVSSLIIGNPLFFWFSWSLGAYLADRHRVGRATFLAKVPPGLWLLLVLGAYMVLPIHRLAFPITALLTAGVMARLVRRPQRAATSRLLEAVNIVGRCSYSIYLIHLPLIAMVPAVLVQFFPSVPYHPLFITFWCWLALIPIVAVSHWMFLRIETPSIKLGDTVVRGIRVGLPT